MSILSFVMYFFLFRILLQYPYIFIALVVAWFLRDRIPSPADWLRRQKAFGRLQQAVAVNPHDSTARRDLGLVLLEKNRPKEALDNFIEALKKDDSAEINHFTGVAYLRSGSAENAERYLRTAVKLDPRFRYGESWQYLGEALLALNRPDEAHDVLKQCLSINNTSIEGIYQYARALSTLGRKDEARKAADDGIRYHKANPAFRRRRDWRAYVKLKSLRRGL